LARKRTAEELTVEELRHLLVEKSRARRQGRLDHFRRTGRVVLVEPEPRPTRLATLRSEAIEIEDEAVSGGDEPTALPGGVSPRPARRRNGWMDRVLFVVEVVAVLGLVFVLLNGLNILRNLNQEVASVLTQATLTPTPLIGAVVLPSGHTPPDVPGGAQPNDAEIPDHLRPLVQSLANLPVPTPGPQQAVRIQIPAIGVDAPVVQGDGWEQLKKGVGQNLGSAGVVPGDNGNLVLSAHNDVFGEIFKDLDRLKKGDAIILFTSQRTYTYVVEQTQIVEPTAVEVMNQTPESIVTLISCYPYMKDTQRIVIKASFQSQ